MDIIALSDLHGVLPKVEKPFDLMLLPGDIVNLYNQSSSAYSESWYLDEFLNWVNTLPYKNENSKVILIAGNHDLGIYRMKPNRKKIFLEALKERSNYRIVYLENELYEFTSEEESIKIFGTPYCKIFGNWAFMGNPEFLKEKYSEIPENLDILISHDAPNIADAGTIMQKTAWSDGTLKVGNEVLTETLLNKNIKLTLVGHIHSGNHNLTEYKPGCWIRNVSILDENYDFINKPFYFQWPQVLSD